MRPILFLFLFLLLACQDGKKESTTVRGEGEEISSDSENESLGKSYTNEKFGVRFNYPVDYEVYEGQLPGDVPVINVFQAGAAEPPLAIHEDSRTNYVAFLPKGYGVDGPGGARKTLQEWDEELPFSFNVDLLRSTVYLLENGTPRAFYLRPENPPENWSEYGGLFVHYGIEDLETKCFDKENRELKPSKNCDPLTGDSLKFYGKIPAEDKEALNRILKSLHFIEKEGKGAASDLIIVQEPEKGAGVSSPLAIKGKARGMWFFEGVAPVQLVTEDGVVIKEGLIEAKESWMTENFVPFEGELHFEHPKGGPSKKEKRGYLLINRANASGKKEHDRVVRIPLVFQ